MNNVERVGLLKMDFLGLRNLTVMKVAGDEIRRTVAPDFDLALIPDDDAKTFEMLGRGERWACFSLNPTACGGYARSCGLRISPTS